MRCLPLAGESETVIYRLASSRAPIAFRVMQPWGPNYRDRQATLISEYATALEAFDAIDQLSAEMAQTGAPCDAVELVVVDATGQGNTGGPTKRCATA